MHKGSTKNDDSGYMYKIIDLTHPFIRAMQVHPDDVPVSLEKVRTLVDDTFNDWKITSGMHAGTHIDGPGHLTDSQTLISSIAVDRFVGKGYLIDARNKTIDSLLLKKLPKEEDLVVLIFTGSSKSFGTKEYFNDQPLISLDFAQELVKHNIKMIGIDFFSPDRYPFDVHKTFFNHDVLIIENLTNLENLLGIEDFTVIALPLKTETDSALARVIALVG